jgi:copper(I)-binding protein
MKIRFNAAAISLAILAQSANMAGLSFVAIAHAQSASREYSVGTLKLAAPWARATPKGAQVGGGYLKITNTGKAADRLTGGSLSIAGRLEVHEMSMDSGMMKMRQLVQGLEIKPGETVELKPGGYHLMFLQLREPLVTGAPLKGTLVFEKAGTVEIEYDVAPIGAREMPASGGHSHH